MNIQDMKRQFIQSFTYQPKASILKEVSDMIPLISFPVNMLRFKSALCHRTQGANQQTLAKYSTLSLTRYAVNMMGLGILLIPLRLVATYMDKKIVVAKPIQPRVLSCSAPILNSLYQEEIQKTIQPIQDWNTGFIAGQVYFSTEEIVEELKIPCGNNIYEENLEPLEDDPSPINLTESCFLKVKLPSTKKVDTAMPNLNDFPPESDAREKQSQKEPCYVQVKVPLQRNIAVSMKDTCVLEDDKLELQNSSTLKQEEAKSLIEPCYAEYKLPSLDKNKQKHFVPHTQEIYEESSIYLKKDKKKLTDPCLMTVKIPKYYSQIVTNRGKNDK